MFTQHGMAVLGMSYSLSVTVCTSGTTISSTAMFASVAYVCTMLLESSIHPFDVLEAEPEIVSG